MVEVNGIVASEESKEFSIDPMKTWEGRELQAQDRWDQGNEALMRHAI